MKDGLTAKQQAPRRSAASFERFLDDFEVRLVALSGPAAGSQHLVDRQRIILGRGPGVDLAFDDQAMSRQHAAVEFADGALRVRDLGSTNGVLVNGRPVQSAELEHGDRVRIGALTFQVLIEERSAGGDAYELPTQP